MSLAMKLGLGTLCAVAVAIPTIALWSASEADKPREDAPEVEQAFWDGFDSELTTNA